MPRVRDLAPVESFAPPGVKPEALLPVAYADTRADDLSYALDLAFQPALRTRSVVLGGLSVELRILGYSHQVVVSGRDGEILLTETVARLPGPARPASARVGALPESHEEFRGTGESGLRRYSIASSVTPLSDLAGIEGLMLELDGAEHAILGVFPGHPHAFTGLLAAPAEASGAQWRSWHAYPGTNELVSTCSRLVGEPA